MAWVDGASYTDYGDIHEIAELHRINDGCPCDYVDEWYDYGEYYVTCGTCADEL